MAPFKTQTLNVSSYAVIGNGLVITGSISGQNITTSFNQGSAVGDFSIAVNSGRAIGNFSFAEGYNSTASSWGSHAEGVNTTASGEASHTEGALTRAIGGYSHAAGIRSVANTYNSWIWRGLTSPTFLAPEVFTTRNGQFMVSAEGGVFLQGNVGIGTDNNENALTVNGRTVLSDQLYYTTDNRVTQLSALSGNYNEGQFLGKIKLSQNNIRPINVGETWTAKNPNKFWVSITISSDGKYQSAVENGAGGGGQIYISSDYGNTWLPKESNKSWFGIAMSSDGKYQSATDTGGQIYISSDYGNTWLPKESNRNWVNITMSSDGKYQSATVYDGLIYISNDYGNTWIAKDSNRNWAGIAMSSDGKYQSATVDSGQIYISNDYGNTWTTKDSNRTWLGIAMSSDGRYQSTIDYGGQIYISNDYGNTWTPKESNRFWTSITMSSDGRYQSATVDGGQIYISNDYGNTWTPKESNRFWTSITMSSDGKYQSATVNGGQIYTSVADELIDGTLNVDGSLSVKGPILSGNNVELSDIFSNTKYLFNDTFSNDKTQRYVYYGNGYQNIADLGGADGAFDENASWTRWFTNLGNGPISGTNYDNGYQIYVYPNEIKKIQYNGTSYSVLESYNLSNSQQWSSTYTTVQNNSAVWVPEDLAIAYAIAL